MKNKVIIFMFGFLVVCCNLFAYATYSCYSPEGNYLGFTNVLDDEKISTVYSIEGKAIGYINFNSYPGRYYNTQEHSEAIAYIDKQQGVIFFQF